MGGLLTVLTPISLMNAGVLRFCRAVGIVTVALMVTAILIQVFFRYVLNDAPAWTEEAARFCMLWMTGLMAPTAFRRGGFVAIDSLKLILPTLPGQLLGLFLLSISLLVLIVGVLIGWNEVFGFGGRFATASLYVPTSFGFDQFYRVPRSWMMASLLVGIVLLISVNVELILRCLATMMGATDRLAPIEDADAGGAE